MAQGNLGSFIAYLNGRIIDYQKKETNTLKVILDLKKLLDEGAITNVEYEKLSKVSAESLSSFAYNLLIGFGVIAVSGAISILLPSIFASILIGALILGMGLMLIYFKIREWSLLANICVIVGSFLLAGSIVLQAKGHYAAFAFSSALFLVMAIVARNRLLIAFSVLASGASIRSLIPTQDWNRHKSVLDIYQDYFLRIFWLAEKAPVITILVFGGLSIVSYMLSKYISPFYRSLALTASGTAFFLMNFGFWAGSVWGEKKRLLGFDLPAWIFSIAWALLLAYFVLYALQSKNRWLLNVTLLFAIVHFYTQWFDKLGSNAWTLLCAGLLAIGFAVVIRRINRILL